jgi:hypothetical protein
MPKKRRAFGRLLSGTVRRCGRFEGLVGCVSLGSSDLASDVMIA